MKLNRIRLHSRAKGYMSIENKEFDQCLQEDLSFLANIQPTLFGQISMYHNIKDLNSRDRIEQRKKLDSIRRKFKIV